MLLGIELDPARRRRQFVLLRVGAEIAEHDVFVGAQRHLDKSVRPEAVEIRQRRLVGARLVAPAIVEVAQPFHLVAALRVGRLAANAARELGKDRVVAARLADRLDRLLHGEDVAVAMRSADVVALERGRRRQHDVGMARGRRPPWLVHDDGLRPLPGAAQPVGVLVMMERIAAGPVDQADIGIGAPSCRCNRSARRAAAGSRRCAPPGSTARADWPAPPWSADRTPATARRCRRPSHSRIRSRRRASRSGRAPPPAGPPPSRAARRDRRAAATMMR